MPEVVRKKGGGASREQRLELELPPFLGALGTLATALLPHIPLLHGWLVLAQLTLPSSPDDADAGDDADDDADDADDADDDAGADDDGQR